MDKKTIETCIGKATSLFKFANIPEEDSPRVSPGIPETMSDAFRFSGGVTEYRGFGKAAFITINDGTDWLQVYIRKDQVGEEKYEAFRTAMPEHTQIFGKLPEVIVEGKFFFTLTKELTLLASDITVH